MKPLAPLRERGVLIIGSGNMVHNLRMVDWDKFVTDNIAFDWALEASEKMKKYILNGDHEKLIDYRSQGHRLSNALCRITF